MATKREPLADAQINQAVHEEPHLDGQEGAVPPERGGRPRVETALNRIHEDEEARRCGMLRRAFRDASRSRGTEENLVVAGMLLGEMQVGKTHPPQRFEGVVGLGCRLGYQPDELGPARLEDNDQRCLLVGRVCDRCLR